jgi:hypothetical protein
VHGRAARVTARTYGRDMTETASGLVKALVNALVTAW